MLLSDITNVKAKGKYKSFFPKRLNIQINAKRKIFLNHNGGLPIYFEMIKLEPCLWPYTIAILLLLFILFFKRGFLCIFLGAPELAL